MPIEARFPGQWFQTESGLHQNWMRDYDPTTGRYLQAEPLGLVDGASVYGYVGQNPGGWIDPMGLKPTTKDHMPGRVCNASSECVIIHADVWKDPNDYSKGSYQVYEILKPGECTDKARIDADYVYVEGDWYKCFSKAGCWVTDNVVFNEPGENGRILSRAYPWNWFGGWVPPPPPEEIKEKLGCCGENEWFYLLR